MTRWLGIERVYAGFVLGLTKIHSYRASRVQGCHNNPSVRIMYGLHKL